MPWPAGTTCTIEIEPGVASSSAHAAAIRREWDRLRALNPRLFDAPILSAVSFTPGAIRARTSTYQRLVVQPVVETGTEQLSVTAVVIARDGPTPRVLLGRRGKLTRIYQEQWELGPSGGIDPPMPLPATPLTPMPMRLGWAEVCAQVRREAAEELGNGSESSAAANWVVPRRTWGVCRDFVARSADIVVECDWTGPAVGDGSAPVPAGPSDQWEYERTAWLSRDEMPAFVRANRVIEPTRALLAAMGWL
ncbi:MAG: hypothetical protein ACKVW3_00150 [Phycisphaerales bacterium]